MFIKDKQFRIKIVFITVILLIIFMFFRILYIQVFSYDKLNNLATSLWQRNLPITADRGRILDRNGNVLAGTVNQYSVEIYKSKIDTEILNNTLLKVATVLE